MPLPNQDKLAHLSRDRSFLVKTGIVAIMVSMILAAIISVVFKPESPVSQRFTDAVREVAQPPKTATELAERIRRGEMASELLQLIEAPDLPGGPTDQTVENMAGQLSGMQDIQSLLSSADYLTSAERTLMNALHLGLNRKKTEVAITSIEATDKGRRFREEFLGDLYLKQGKTAEAADAYLREVADFPESEHSRWSAIKALRMEKDQERLKVYAADPEFISGLSISEQVYLFADLRDYWKLALATARLELQQLGSVFVIPAIYSALIWLLILLSFSKGQKRTIALASLGILAGIFSAWLTIYFVILQEYIQGFNYERQVTPLGRTIYFVAGVALREEVAKLICFIPLAILLKKQNSYLIALVVAGSVGLGFAAQENIAYFYSPAGDSSYTPWVRLLTANALHIALTGVIGFYFYRMLIRRGRGWDDFLLNFIMMVVAHGMYNSMLSLPSLQDYSVFSFILIALVVYRYLDPLRANIDTNRLHRRLSPLGIFVLGSIFLVCGTLVFSAFGMPFRFAFSTFANAVGGMVPTAFVFINRFRDL